MDTKDQSKREYRVVSPILDGRRHYMPGMLIALTDRDAVEAIEAGLIAVPVVEAFTRDSTPLEPIKAEPKASDDSIVESPAVSTEPVSAGDAPTVKASPEKAANQPTPSSPRKAKK